ncbi:hypothetical protein BBJ28_00002317 [Nothophytophthora sp. Chile5]|nr:hypothetical protein BBJ28_00002317 [Nothophytophthora sp. Chile5]
MGSLVTQVQSGLKARVAPIPVDDCTGGVYYLRSKNRRLTAVFKPADEEAYAPNNPKHYHARVQSPSRSGMRQGIAAGDSAVREVVAYLLDRQHFAKVPATMLASAFHPDFHYQPSESPHRKVGALQAYVPHKDTADDVGSNLFSVADVHAIAMLDIRLANQDRHGGNILVVEQSPPTIKQPSGKQFALVPIDHGACLPRVSALSETSFLWLLWSQAKQPFSAAALEYIAALDASRDLKLLETNIPKGYELEREAVLTLHVCTALLQFCALEHHMTAHAIGLLMCRQGTCHQQELKPSVLETLVASSLQDPAVFKSEALLKVQEKQQHQHSKLQLSPTAVTSANTPVKTVNPHEKAWDTYVTTFMTAFRRELASHFAFK